MRIFKQSLISLGLLLAAAPFVRAEEPFNEFFDGLLQRGYYEQAIWYVDSVSNNPTLPNEIKNTLLYRKAQAQIEASRYIANLQQRGAMLEDASNNLAEFLKQHPKNDRAIDATIERGTVLSSQARVAQALARKEDSAAAKAPFLKEARDKYAEARKIYEAANTQIRDTLSKLGKVLDPTKDGAKIAFRDEMRASYIQTQMLAATCLLESAKTLDEKSEERKKQLEQAAKEFGETYSKYKDFLAGLYARLYEAQAQQALGKDKEAISIYQDDLFKLLEDQPERMRRVKLKAAIGLANIWLKQEAAPKVVNELAPWLEAQQLRPNDLRDEEWLELRYLVAQAYLADAAALGPKDKSYATYRRAALKLATEIAKYPNEYKKKAIEIKIELQGAETVAQNTPEPKTFQEAVIAGRELLTKANTQQQIVIAKLQKDLAAASDDATKQELTSKIETEEKTVQDDFAQAKLFFQQAMRLADRDTPRDEINNVQYHLSYLSFQEGQYWQTFARASFIAEHYPNSSSAQACSIVSLKSAYRLFESAPADQRSFELSLVKRVTDFVAKQWPNSEEAGQAQLALVGLQLQQASAADLPWQQQKTLIGDAENIVTKMADGNSAKADAQLKIGQMYWSLFNRGKALKRAAGKDNATQGLPDDKELAALKQKAESILTAGVNQFKGNDADYTYVLAAISLAQIYTDTGEAQKAVALLEEPKLGLLSLVEANNKAANVPGVKQFIYRAAVRTYISALSTTKDPAQTETMMANAEKAMGELQNLAGDDAKSQKELIAIYISLATDLKQQLDNAEPSQKESLGAAFEKFLDRLAQTSSEPNVLNWVGETFYNVGQSFSEDPSYKGDASNFYKKAIAAYQRILDKNSSDDVNPALLQQVRVRIAMAQRETGQYEEALTTFANILEQNNMIVNVQVEAAKTYYLWGLNGGDSKTFYQAMMGTHPDPKTKKNTIWGWGRLQAILARYAKRGAEPSPYKDVFYESRYYLAACRYQYALAQDSEDKKKQYLGMAAKDITSTQLFDPGLGGEPMWSKFDALMKKIQKDLTGTPQGLEKK
ncbi:hypothetical protein DTL42_22815 [Bremerella cremea]|uniref:Tetratricopeptide repeat protein n=1 Tax=Bremerella cremea TaxID=1031537 RepID=A0A368KN57_9BACT|nr:hypothetical protein [Bremerella cremea]RCS41393.1 hypothetical protein DTL42_22815 [Bremerella cremea]